MSPGRTAAFAADVAFDAEDDFILGETAEPFAFEDNTAPPPNTSELLLNTEDDTDAPPFDAPEMDDEIFQAPHLHKPSLLNADERPETDALLLTTPSIVAPLAPRAEEAGAHAPAPPISIYVCWDRTEIAENLVAPLLHHPLLRRARMDVDRGGVEAAATRVATDTPDLFVIDTNLSAAAMLPRLDALAPAVKQGAKIIVLGAVNDISLLRELAARGVNEYIVPPLSADALAQSICRLYAETDNSRVVAVIGARGGVGASTIAHNLAWSIAERQHAGAAIVDLDLSFGAAALAFGQTPARSLADVLEAASADEDLLDAIPARPTPRLQIFSAPAKLQRTFALEDTALQSLITRVRRTSPYVVLDLPHAWTSWIKDALLKADDVVIVTGPDLASLSSAKSMLEALKTARPEIAPIVVMSMVGVPKRPEITFKDFSGALCLEPPFSFAFDPALLGQAALEGKMIGEVAPNSKMAKAIDELAALLTGRDPLAEPTSRSVEAEALPKAALAEGVRGTLQRLKHARGRAGVRGADYLARARDAARASAKRAPPPQQRRTSPALRAATALVVMLTLCAWNIDHLRPEAQAAEPARVQATSPAMTPIDHAAAFTAARAAFDADPQQGLPRLRALAEAGFAPAQYHLAKLYERGEGVNANLDEARAWTERAANAGEINAMHDLGVYYARGEGADANPVTAFRWFRQAAAHGLTDSQYNLGVLYEQGRGVTADPAEALFWFTLAAAHGDEAAATRAAALEERVTPIYVEQARARAAQAMSAGH